MYVHFLGDNQYQSFKLKSVGDGVEGINGQKYFIAEFSYDLLTGAGFIVERKGFAGLTQVGTGVQLLVSATTAKRFKELKPQLQEVAKSFRVYKDILV
ncbi:unnamed protein product [Chrysoparadoxa australica]